MALEALHPSRDTGRWARDNTLLNPNLLVEVRNRW
jgi:hypothetical protein